MTAHTTPTLPDRIGSIRPRWFAVAGLVLWLTVLSSMVTPAGGIWVEYVGIALHLAMFMLVFLLPAPEWARAAGYGWIVLELATGVLTMHGDPMAIYLRLAGHTLTGIWIVAASAHSPMPLRIAGTATGLWLAGYTFASPYLPLGWLAPASLLMVAWFVLVIVHDGTGRPTGPGRLRHP